MAEIVLVTGETDAKACVYHTQDCQGIMWSEREEITLEEAEKRGLKMCSFCDGTAYVQGPAQKLLEMDADDVLGGGKA